MECHLRYALAAFTAMLVSLPAFAGQPTPGALGLQAPATEIARDQLWFHGFVMVIITIITIFVLALIIWVCLRYNKRAHPEPRKFSHNTAIEIVWTLAPVLILCVIAVPSFELLFKIEDQPDLQTVAEKSEDAALANAAEQGWITVKVEGMGNWAWTYYYMDELDEEGYPVQFVSNPLHLGLPDDPVGTPTQPKYLAVDYPMVIPVNRYIRYQTTSDRVIHSWTVPAFGVKTDAVPGRLNEGWFLVEKTGTYFGQCSELCGKNHAFMPIEVRVVEQDVYDQWVATMKSGELDAATQLVETKPLTTGATRLALAE